MINDKPLFVPFPRAIAISSTYMADVWLPQFGQARVNFVVYIRRDFGI